MCRNLPQEPNQLLSITPHTTYSLHPCHPPAYELPLHKDGSRGSLIFAFGLWSNRSLRIHVGSDNELAATVRTRSGHAYVAGLMGTEHQVVHDTSDDGERFQSSVLGEIEIVLLVRSCVLSYNRLSNACFCYNEGKCVFSLLLKQSLRL